MNSCIRIVITFAILILFVSNISFANTSATKTSVITASVSIAQQTRLQQALNQWQALQ